MPVQTRSQKAKGAHLPQSLLEMILISGTSTEDKKALRQTCKMFREALDGRLQQLGVWLGLDEDVQHCERLLRRMQHVHGLSIQTLRSCKLGRLLDHMPDNLMTLRIIHGRGLSLEALSRLRHLTALDVIADGCVTGLQNISGLTSLQCYDSDVGSLAHLAPTLKRLSTLSYDSRLHLEQLTNLTTLTVQGVPADFFATHSKLPLKHLYIRDKQLHRMNDVNFWQPAMPTLTSLTLYGTPNISLTVIPVTITHLQLLNAYDVIDQAITALPQLKRLDVRLNNATKHVWNIAFNNLCRHTNLQELGMCVVENGAWQRDQVVSELPVVAKAVGRGVRLNVVDHTDEFTAFFQNPRNLKSAWSIYT